MSDHFIALIPADPNAVPPDDTLDALRDRLAGIAGSNEARVKHFGERLQFIDCGENFARIFCPACGAEADTGWWGQRMDHAWDADHGFHLCEFEMPCCGAKARLDTLGYEDPQGFAHWFVSARNANRGSLTAAETSALESVAGIPLKVVYQKY